MMTPNVIVNYSCAPMMSMDCEGGGAFSTLKDLLSSKRNCLQEAHLNDLVELILLLMETAVYGLINHPKCVEKKLRFIFICFFRSFFCMFIYILSSIFVQHFEIPNHESFIKLCITHY